MKKLLSRTLNAANAFIDKLDNQLEKGIGGKVSARSPWILKLLWMLILAGSFGYGLFLVIQNVQTLRSNSGWQIATAVLLAVAAQATLQSASAVFFFLRGGSISFQRVSFYGFQAYFLNYLGSWLLGTASKIASIGRLVGLRNVIQAVILERIFQSLLFLELASLFVSAYFSSSTESGLAIAGVLLSVGAVAGTLLILFLVILSRSQQNPIGELAPFHEFGSRDARRMAAGYSLAHLLASLLSVSSVGMIGQMMAVDYPVLLLMAGARSLAVVVSNAPFPIPGSLMREGTFPAFMLLLGIDLNLAIKLGALQILVGLLVALVAGVISAAIGGWNRIWKESRGPSSV